MPTKLKRHTIRFEMLLTEEQNQHWEALSQRAGLSRAELVRRRMANCRIQTIPKANWQTYWQLGKIGNNINQIAKAQNTATSYGLTPPPIDPIPFEQLQKQIDKLRLHLLLGMDDEVDEVETQEADDWKNW